MGNSKKRKVIARMRRKRRRKRRKRRKKKRRKRRKRGRRRAKTRATVPEADRARRKRFPTRVPPMTATAILMWRRILCSSSRKKKRKRTHPTRVLERQRPQGRPAKDLVRSAKRTMTPNRRRRKSRILPHLKQIPPMWPMVRVRVRLPP